MASAAGTSGRVRSARRHAARLWAASANPDGPGLLLRGREFEPVGREAFDPLALTGVLRLARLATAAADALADCPHPAVRRAAAVLAARAHPVRAGLDD